MIQGGYYIKARCIANKTIAHASPHIREVWDYLLREANHKDNHYQSHLVKRGQLFRTYKDIRESLCWYVGWRKETYSENQMKATMRYLRKHLMITTTKTLGGVLITVINYDTYQNPKNYENPNDSPNDDTFTKPTRAPSSADNNKNVKNVKNNKNVKKQQQEPSLDQDKNSNLTTFLKRCCSEKFVFNIFKKYSKEKIEEACRVLRESKDVDNAEAFIKMAIKEGWESQQTKGRAKREEEDTKQDEKLADIDAYSKLNNTLTMGGALDYKTTTFYKNLATDELRDEFDLAQQENQKLANCNY